MLVRDRHFKGHERFSGESDGLPLKAWLAHPSLAHRVLLPTE